MIKWARNATLQTLIILRAMINTAYESWIIVEIVIVFLFF